MDISNIKLTLPIEENYTSYKLNSMFRFLERDIKISDLALLLGGRTSEPEFVSGLGRGGFIATKSIIEEKYFFVVGKYGCERKIEMYKKDFSILPVLDCKLLYYELLQKSTKKFYYGKKFDVFRLVEFGEYPQQAASKELQKILEDKYNYGKLQKTGKTYTFNGEKINELSEEFIPTIYDEYIYNNQKYIRISPNIIGGYYNNNKVKLTNGEVIKERKKVWIKVSPVKWIIDTKSKEIVSYIGLVAGIPFNVYPKISDISTSFIKKYLDDYMVNDLFNLSKQKINNETIQEKTAMLNNENIYNLDFENVTEEDIIKGAIESDVAVFLHGNSSEGKSARIKTLDKDAVMIYLCNATPDSLNGKSVYNSITNEMIDIKPTWLIKLESICEKEPDKNHILFFDELTNALPSIQGIAFNIILDKEVNGKWKLPDNARVVAAGNEMEESISANKLSKPLFNRFAHVYIKTTTSSWIKWASENNIHPAIISYIAYTNGKALRSEYTGEKPNADPRKWEMASKVLYKTGKPEMIRALVGNEITKEFCHFCKTKTITLNDIVNGNITEEMLNMDIAEKYITVGSLTNIDIKYYEVVKCFIEKLGKEYLSLFNLLWSQNNEEKLEMVLEYEMEGKRNL